MSEEEIEIIKFLTIFNKSEIDYCKLEKVDVKAILTLIEKQQKEINKEKEKNKELEKEIKEYRYSEDISFKCLEKTRYMQNFISKDKIKNLILKYRCFGWHNKDDEYWANRILDGFEDLLKEK